MKHVFLIDTRQDFKKIKNDDCQIDGIYFGNEFCDFLIPTANQIDRMVDTCKKRGYFLSVVLPYVNQSRLNKCIRVLEHLDKKYPHMEVIINDWGILQFIKENKLNLRIGLGRLMSRQKRGYYLIKDDNTKVPVDQLDITCLLYTSPSPRDS